MTSSGAPVERKVVRHGKVGIEYYAQGSGPLVVLLPSLGRGATDFDEIRVRLAHACRVVTPQPRGIDGSYGPSAGVTLHDYARDAACVIDTFISDVERGRVLSDAELKTLHDIGLRLETFFGSPQDVEWCIRGGELLVLQSRPITTLGAHG